MLRLPALRDGAERVVRRVLGRPGACLPYCTSFCAWQPGGGGGGGDSDDGAGATPWGIVVMLLLVQVLVAGVVVTGWRWWRKRRDREMLANLTQYMLQEDLGQHEASPRVVP